RTATLSVGDVPTIGDRRTRLYTGASPVPEASSDVLVLSAGNSGSGTIVGINLAAGLLLQLDPHLALTLQTGYSAAIGTSGGTRALHFIPVGLEAVVTPVPRFDIGARFFLDGYIAPSGGSSSGNPNYFDLRALMFYFRVHA